MTSLQERFQPGILNEDGALFESDVFYFRQSFRNAVFQKLLKVFADKAQYEGFTQSDVAAKLAKDRGQISRIFAGPKNWTLDTLSDLALALDMEVEIAFEDLRVDPRHNFCHNWIAEIDNPLGAMDIKTFAVQVPTSSSSFEIRHVQ